MVGYTGTHVLIALQVPVAHSACQEILSENVTIASVIIVSDETQLMQFRGDKSMWPVYLTIGNIAKATWCKPSHHATVLLGYLPSVKLTCFTNVQVQHKAGWSMFHHCLDLMLCPLVETGLEGIDMICADSFVRRIHPILAAYVCDYPEQVTVAGVKKFWCPKCQVSADDDLLGSPVQSL